MEEMAQSYVPNKPQQGNRNAGLWTQSFSLPNGAVQKKDNASHVCNLHFVVTVFKKSKKETVTLF